MTRNLWEIFFYTYNYVLFADNVSMLINKYMRDNQGKSRAR